MVKIKGPKEGWESALFVAKAFDTGYPDRLGVQQGVGYFHNGYKIYVYRTKTQLVAWVDNLG